MIEIDVKWKNLLVSTLAYLANIMKIELEYFKCMKTKMSFEISRDKVVVELILITYYYWGDSDNIRYLNLNPQFPFQKI